MKAEFKYIAVTNLILALWLILNLNTGSQIYAFGTRMFSKEAIEYRLKGYQASQNKNYEEAIKYLQKACSLDPYYAAPHNDLGIIYEIKGWLEKAEVEYLRVLSIDPNNSESVMNLALLYESRNSIDKAVPYFQRRIELGPLDSPWVKRAKVALANYAPELYKEITEKEEARNLMYSALEEKYGKVPDSASKLSEFNKETTFEAKTKEPELINDDQLENYLKLEKDILNPEMKQWLLGLTSQMFAFIYGKPAYKKVFTGSGRCVNQSAWNKFISGLGFGPSMGKEVYYEEGRSQFKEKWIYEIPAKYKKYALKRQIKLIFEDSILVSWER